MMNELFNIKDQVVVITGGTGVLGKTIAKYLALNGAKVVILGRRCRKTAMPSLPNTAGWIHCSMLLEAIWLVL